MKWLIITAGILVGGIVGMFIELFVSLHCYLKNSYCIPLLGGMVGGAAIGGVIVRLISRYSKVRAPELAGLPAEAADFVRLIARRMRYRRTVRQEVLAELAAHFEDALRDCKSDQEKQEKARRLIADFGEAKLLGVLLRRAKKRCRPMWRTVVARTFQSLAILLACLIVYCVYISLGEPTIRVNYVEELARIARPPADESLNAAPLYQKAASAYKEPAWLKQTSGSKREPDLLRSVGQKRWPGNFTTEELSAMRRWVSDNAQALELFKQASDKPYCWWKRQAEDGSLPAMNLPELSKVESLCRVLSWRARLRAYDGRLEEAFEDVLVCYQVGRHYKGPRTLIEQLVGIAIQAGCVQSCFEILGQQQPDAQLLRDFQEKLEDRVTKDSFTIDYSFGRLLALDFLQRCYTDNGKGSGHVIPARVLQYLEAMGQSPEDAAAFARSLLMTLVSADREQMRAEFDKIYQKVQQWAKMTPWQLRDEQGLYGEIEQWSGLKRARLWPLYVLAPATLRLSELAHLSKAEIEALITALAILRYKNDKAGLPASLQELLEGGYIRKLPMDPYSDGPLVYKRTAGGFTLYSIGSDFEDDGGKQLGRWGDEGGDRVFWPVESTSSGNKG